MPTTHTHPAPLIPLPPAKMRPIPEIGPGARARRRSVPLTDRRLAGVAAPTARLVPPAPPAPMGHAPSGAPLTVLVAGAVATALQSLDALERQAHEAADDFRSAHVDAGRRSLRNLVQSTRTLIRLAAMTAHVTGTDVHTFCRTTGLPADERTQNALDLLTARLLAKDWPALGALLDEEFTGALNAWRAFFEALGSFCHDGGPGGLAA